MQFSSLLYFAIVKINLTWLDLCLEWYNVSLTHGCSHEWTTAISHRPRLTWQWNKYRQGHDIPPYTVAVKNTVRRHMQKYCEYWQYHTATTTRQRESCKPTMPNERNKVTHSKPLHKQQSLSHQGPHFRNFLGKS